jgi:FKBP-type peptidyl-prolyl cis-trans isomerase FkpA
VVISTGPLYLRKFFKMIRKLVGVAVIFLSFAQLSCLKGNTDCNFKPCQYPAPASEIQAVSSYLSSNGLTATQHCSGVFYSISNAGSGKSPDGCSEVFVTYTGRTSTGGIFDSRSSPFYINLNGGIITGWRSGLSLIKEGGSITLYIPPALGYGAEDVKDNNGNVVIPANSILIFDITLTSVQ